MLARFRGAGLRAYPSSEILDGESQAGSLHHDRSSVAQASGLNSQRTGFPGVGLLTDGTLRLAEVHWYDRKAEQPFARLAASYRLRKLV